MDYPTAADIRKRREELRSSKLAPRKYIGILVHPNSFGAQIIRDAAVNAEHPENRELFRKMVEKLDGKPDSGQHHEHGESPAD